MSLYAIELLTAAHDRANFTSGLDTVDRYFREVAREHLEKGVTVTRVLVEKEDSAPKPVFGFFTLSGMMKGQAKYQTFRVTFLPRLGNSFS